MMEKDVSKVQQKEVLNGFAADGEICQQQVRKTVMFYSK